MPEPPRVVIVGAGPQAKVAIDIITARGQARIIGVLDDDVAKHETDVVGCAVLGTVSWGLDMLPRDVDFFVAIGGNTPRTLVADRIRVNGRKLTNAVHPSAVVSGGVMLGSNILVCANAVIGVETIVRDDAVINTSVSVDHESLIGFGAYLAPGVHTAGRVRIGREAFIGAGSTLGPGVTIGDGAVVGAGSLVLGDITANVLAWGRPARTVRQLDDPIDWAALLGGRTIV